MGQEQPGPKPGMREGQQRKHRQHGNRREHDQVRLATTARPQSCRRNAAQSHMIRHALPDECPDPETAVRQGLPVRRPLAGSPAWPAGVTAKHQVGVGHQEDRGRHQSGQDSCRPVDHRGVLITISNVGRVTRGSDSARRRAEARAAIAHGSPRKDTGGVKLCGRKAEDIRKEAEDTAGERW